MVQALRKYVEDWQDRRLAAGAREAGPAGVPSGAPDNRLGCPTLSYAVGHGSYAQVTAPRVGPLPEP